MKGIKGLLLCAVMVLRLLSGPANAKPAVSFELGEGVPDGWNTQTLSQASVIEPVEFEGTPMLALKNDTSAGKETASAVLTSQQFNLQSPYAMRLEMAMEQTVSGTTKTLTLLAEDGTECKLLRVNGDTWELWDSTTFSCPQGQQNVMEVAVDPERNIACVWVNGICVGQDLALEQGFDYSNFSIEFKDGYGRKQGMSAWYLGNLQFCEMGEYQIETFPENEAVYVDSTICREVTVQFGTGITCVDKSSVILLENGQNAEFILEQSLQELRVILPEGLHADASYNLTITGIVDLFGAAQEDVVVAFTTAPEGYEPLQAVITSPESGTKVLQGTNVEIKADITEGSSPFYQGELLVNGESVAWCTALPCEFVVSAQGQQMDCVVRAYDESGGVYESEAVTILVLEDTPSEIVISGLEEEGTVEPGSKVTVNASDVDGSVTKIDVAIDKIPLASGSGGEISASLPEDLSYGNHTLTVTCEDELGSVTEKSINFYCSIMQANVLYEANFSDFESTKEALGSVPGLNLVPQSAPQYIINGKAGDREDNCIIVGADGATVGNSAYFAWWASNYSENNITVRTSIFLNDANTKSVLTVRTDETIQPPSVLFGEDVIFSGETLTCYNGQETSTYPIELQTWYDVVMKVNLSTSTYTLILDGGSYSSETVVKNYAFRQSIHSCSCVRWVVTTAEPGGWTAFSTFRLETETSYPCFNAVSYLKNSEQVSGELALEADTLWFQTLSQIPESTTNPSIRLLCEGIEVPAGVATLDNAGMRVQLTQPILQSCSYTAVLDCYVNGSPYQAIYNFDAPSGTVDVEETAFRSSGGQLELTGVMKCPQPTEIMIIITKSKNGQMQECFVSRETLSGGEKFAVPVPYEAGCSYRAVIRKDWSKLTPINHKIYSYES